MAVTSELNVAFSDTLQFDRYQPADATPKGLVIDIHGGGWFRGDKQKDQDVATWFAQNGYLTIVPNYHLVPEGYFPVPLEDMDQLFKQIRQQYPNLPVAVFGSSAGGNMAVEMGIKYKIPVISLSGILDIKSWLETHQDVVAKPDQKQDFKNAASSTINQTGDDDPFYKWFILNYLKDSHFADQATPASHIKAKSGPMLLINSLNEFVPISGVFQVSTQLARFQTPVETILLSGTRHAKGYLKEVQPNILLFLKKYLTNRSD